MAGDALLGREMGRYRVESIIGSGGFATVYRAVDLALERPVALKVVDPTAHRNPTIGRRFVLEGRAVASLDHPAVVPVFDAGETDGVLWMAMRLIAGGSLDDALVAGRRFTFDQVVAIAARIGGALDHAHGHGIVHRDVKPSNILLEHNDPGLAWLADFGIAATTRTAGRYTTGALGTAAYMAPEQARPSSVGPPADLYSLGCVVYELLTRRRPFPGDDYVELLVAHATHPVPPTPWPRVDAFLQRALAKDPSARPPSGRAFAEELGRTLAEAERTRPGAAPVPVPAEAEAGDSADAGDDADGEQPVPLPPPPPPHRPGDPVGAPAAAQGADIPPAPPAHRPGDPVGETVDRSPDRAPPPPPPSSPVPKAASKAASGEDAPTVVERVEHTLEHPQARRLPPPPMGPPPGRPGPPTAFGPPPAPRDPTVVRTGRRKGRRRLVAGGVLLAVGIVAVAVALYEQRREPGRKVEDRAGISYEVPDGWALDDSQPPDVLLVEDGSTMARVSHEESDGGSAAEQLDDADPSVCEDEATDGPGIPGAEQVAMCTNTSVELPILALGAIADGQFWVITVSQATTAAERDELLESVDLRAPA